ncbi:MAG: ring canal Kelch protein [Deltaproteobacteria bacterium]|nr:ring canal Kelch protein [Deltaproteobacteria bacterium]
MPMPTANPRPIRIHRRRSASGSRIGLALLVAILASGELACTAPTSPDGTAARWTRTSLPGGKRRLEPAVAASGTRLVIAGGFSTSLPEGLEITDEVLALDTLATNTPTGGWTKLPRLPVRWHHGALAASAGALYLLGGFEGPNADARGESFVLELGATEWTPLPAMPDLQARGGAGVVTVPGHIYLLGGSNRSGPLASCLDFDLIDRTWSPLMHAVEGAQVPVVLPTPRSHVAAMQSEDGSLVIAGGLDDANRALGDTYRLPLGASVWELRAPMTNRGGCAYGVAFGSLVCAGGEIDDTVASVVERYDPRSAPGSPADEWSALPELPEPRGGTQGAVIGGSLYVPGGSKTRTFEPTSTLFVLSLEGTVAMRALGPS